MENAELEFNTEPMKYEEDQAGNQARNRTAAQPMSGSENCLPVGTRLSEFELTGVVGEGGFGSVYLAFDHSLQRTVAIKEYMPGALAGRNADKSVQVRSDRHRETFQTGLRSFINEARLLAQFDHPALIKVHRFWEQNNTAYMAMRYYEGLTLKNVIKHHRDMVTEQWLRSMLAPILEALDALYKINILHRDISPDNIMIQNTGCAVLLDFGAARQIIGDMTKALTVILKPGYAPVEQYADDGSMKQGPWTDIYALSAVLYDAITKKPPPTSVARMIKDPIELLSTEKYPDFSAAFLSAINAGLSVNPEARPQSIDEFRRLLDLEAAPAASAAKTATATTIPTAVAANPVPDRLAVEKTIVITKSDTKAKPISVEPPVAVEKPAEVHIANPPLQAQGAPDETVVASPIPLPPTDKKAEPAIPPQEIKAPAADKKSAAAGSTTVKPRSRKPVLPVVALLVVLGIGAYGGFLYFHPDQAPAMIADLIAPPQPKPIPLPPPQTVQPPQPSVDEEAVAWESLKDANRPTADSLGDLAAFIDQYPHGKYATAATQKLNALTQEIVKLREDSLTFVAPANASADPNDLAGIASGSIALTIKPWGNVTIDDVSKGASPPVKKIRLAEGKHHIKIVNASFPDYALDIDVVKNQTLNIEHDFTAH
jgi:serine/threonine protein kinase